MDLSGWIGILILLIIIEAATAGLASIWYVASTIVVIIAKLLGLNNIYVEFGICLVLGTILLIFTRPILNKLLRIESKATNLDRVVGMRAKVISDINKKEMGYVKVDGKEWRAYSDENIKKDEYVKVLEIDGNKLKVRREK